MIKPFQFQFRSITHRLIFACLITAIFIYTISYSQIHHILDKGVVSWMTDVAQSRVNSVVLEIEMILSSIEHDSKLISSVNSTDEYKTITTLLAQKNPFINGIAVENSPDLSISFSSGKTQPMTTQEKETLLTSCQNISTWTYFDRTSSLSYCISSKKFNHISISVLMPYLCFHIKME